tara:strand:+ start:2792 stop:3133 length:342 start_codon:yes stop_codon:yes gene_type:complete
MPRNNYLDYSKNILVFKQGFKPMIWTQCYCPVEIKYIFILINLLINNPNSMHKIQYINDKNITSYLKGELQLKSESKTENNIIRNIKMKYYDEKKDFTREIVIIKLPEHNGLN